MRRLFTSWVALVGLVVLLAVGTAGILHQIKEQMLLRSDQGEIRTARILTGLAVHRTVDGTDSSHLTLTPQQRHDIDTDVADMRSTDQLVALEVWQMDGTLVYADPGHVMTAGVLQAPDRRLAAAGQPWLVVTGAPELSDANTHVVFLPYDAGRDGTLDGVVMVALPESSITGEINRSMVELYAIAALLLTALVGMLVTFRRRVLSRERAARQDPLTGLQNRLALRSAIEVAVADARDEDGRYAALLVLDLDGFRAINDTLGHPAGDVLLVQVARSLLASVRPSDVVARLGGDEFAILLRHLPDRARSRAVASDLLDRLTADSYNVNGIELNVDASIGIALLPEHGDTMDLLLQRADVAMYQAKSRNAGVSVYDETDDPHDITRLGLLVELRRAIEQDELVLHYQPKTDLRTGDLQGVEALVRWQHPIRGELAPNTFIPMAETTGLMLPLTEWVLRHAVAQAARWYDAGLMIPVAVNVSPRSLLDRDLPRSLLRLLADAGLPAHLLELEITETAIMTDPARANQLLRELKAMGVRVAIDDFGVGYTSLAYLKSLPVHTLKIDRCFISQMLVSDRDQAIVESIIGLGHKLGMTVLAEGIATEPVLNRLKSLSCDQGQGFLIGRPMPADRVDAWVTAHLLGGTQPGQAPAPARLGAPARRPSSSSDTSTLARSV